MNLFKMKSITALALVLPLLASTYSFAAPREFSEQARETLESLRMNNVQHYILNRAIKGPGGTVVEQTLILAAANKSAGMYTKLPMIKPKSERSWASFFIKYGTPAVFTAAFMNSVLSGYHPIWAALGIPVGIIINGPYWVIDKILRQYFAFTDTMVGAFFFPGAYFSNWSEVTSASDNIQKHMNFGHSEALFVVEDKYLEVNKNDLIDRLGYHPG